MILVIRISGIPNVSDAVDESMNRIKLRRKYSAVLLHPTPENIKLLTKIRDFIAYGDVNHETLKELIEKRAQPLKKGTKIDAEKISKEVEKKSLENLGIKSFFRLHPPRGGIESKK